ncbi:MAG TPA: DUF5989 family protein [Planctomycetota bacterium]|nr:DUF5989 family protein [Planctomycetota bacterium]
MENQPRDPRLERLERRSMLGEVWGFLRAKRAYWLLPLILVLLLVSAVVILGETPAGYLVYALF